MGSFRDVAGNLMAVDSRNVGDYALKARMSKKEAAEQIRRAGMFLEMATPLMKDDSDLSPSTRFLLHTSYPCQSANLTDP